MVTKTRKNLFQCALSEDEQANLAAEIRDYEAQCESGLVLDDIPAWMMSDIDRAVERHTAMLHEWFS